MVERAIAKCVQAAMDGSVNQTGGAAGQQVTRIGITIQSPNLENGDITLPLRPTWMNTVKSMMRKFLKAEQSDRTNSLYDAPITIRITTLTGHEGRGPGDRPVRHAVAPTALINVGLPPPPICRRPHPPRSYYATPLLTHLNLDC